MEASSDRALLLLRILLFCALASAATILLPLATRPCANSLSRTILAVTGLDPYLISCAGDASEASLSEGDGAGKKPRSGGPIVTDLLWCGKPDLPPHALPPFHCCPPMPSSEPINFTFPDPGEPLRTRRPVHEVGAEYMAKYARAVALMKALPHDDPRSFYQQANIHCAYCTGAYRQVGRPELPVQIHFSWLFFPFHRAYLYFFERIAAKLLGDPGFAMPFWSWDVPEGMRIPAEFAAEASPLYDPIRNPRHAPPTVVDLDFMDVEKNYTNEQQIQYNLWAMYKQMISNAPLPSLFHGQPYRAGDAEKPGAGTVEIYPHNTMHGWTGDISRPNHEDMGVYYSAGRDPIFYPHHANIDRLWEAWRRIGVARGNRRQVDFTDPDWLESSFLFYDEEARLVRVSIRDMLDMGRLRYRYAGVGLPWLSARPPATPGVNSRRGKLKSVSFPVSLDAAVSVEVRRPGTLRSRREKEAREEVLVVEGVETDGADFVKFDVYVNAVEYEKVGPGGREMAGSFVTLKHPGKEGMVMRTSMRVALNELLEDLGADGDESITVTLVPARGKARIGGLRIVYMAE
ncbi:polyphenol oxidase I, chloroplastic-like [Phragmites australis]|uniref:polyphenol oxidase I, chloroplastic-like n=1 Tax=Phragmites australis TaxID=29695 RepID=UPI002D7A357C|nr:polyphenol oxidase I, chloroplastic-like [Phragmites australis]